MRKAALLGALLAGALGVFFSLAPPSLYGGGSCPYLQPGVTLASLVHAAPRAARTLLDATTRGVGVRVRSAVKAVRRTVAGPLRLTRAALRAHDGSDARLPLLLGMRGDIFDVTELGSQYYGRGMAYNCFAGRDATRALALGSLDPKDIDNWRTDDFTTEQLANLDEQHKFYSGKYPKVGEILEEGA